jgi:hypothetical protein
MPEQHRRYHAHRLQLVAKAEQFRDSREPPLRIGDWVRLNSGGPIALVVDAGELLTVAWRNPNGLVSESTLAPACYHRVCLSSI